MIFGSLFTGAGLMDLGVEAAGFRCAWAVERDPFCRAVLAQRRPALPVLHDVRFVDGSTLLPVDAVVGGFPCQDVSLAGDGAGLAGARSGLWFDMLRIIADVAPRGVLIENVPGLLRRGLDAVVSGLHALGYEVEASRIRAEDLGAPHRRERLFIVAHAKREHVRQQPRRSCGPCGAGETLARGGGEAVADASGAGLEERRKQSARGREGERSGGLLDGQRAPLGDDAHGRGLAWPAQPGMGRGADGLSVGLDGLQWPASRGEEQKVWEPPRTVSGPAKVPHRRARLRALGNGNVPACAFVGAMRLRERLGAA